MPCIPRPLRGLLVAALLVLALAAPVPAQQTLRQSPTTTVAVTDVNQSVTPPGLSYVLVRNDGPDTVWVQLDGPTATAGDPSFALPPGTAVSPFVRVGNPIGLIAATGQSATATVLFVRGVP